jgi:predicted nucleic acid-binding protein
MSFVVDCSVTVPWYIEDEATLFTDSLLNRVGQVEIHAPGLWVLEFSSAILNAEKRRRITAADRLQIIAQASQLPLVIDTHLPSLTQFVELTNRYQLTPYDAAYLELALRRSATLCTLDAALVRTAREASCSLLTDLNRYPE